MKLVDDIDNLYKRWSTRIAAVQVGSAVLFWAAMPDDLRDAVPHWVKCAMVAGFGLMFIGAQSVKQQKLQKRDDCDKDKDQ